MAILIIALVAYAGCGLLAYFAASLEHALMDIPVGDVHAVEQNSAFSTPAAVSLTKSPSLLIHDDDATIEVSHPRH